MALKNTFLVGIFSTLIPWTAIAETPDSAEILNVQMSGTGCSQSAAAVSLSPDLKDMSVLFDNYFLEIGTGTALPSATAAQKNCTIQIDMGVPAGWQFAFSSTDYRGFAALPASAWAYHRFAILSQNQAISTMQDAQLRGPVEKVYDVRVQTRPERMVWSSCDGSTRRVQLFSQLGVSYFPNTRDRSIAQIALDSNDTSFRNSFGVEWRRCAVTNPGTQPPRPAPRPPGSGPVRPAPRP